VLALIAQLNLPDLDIPQGTDDLDQLMRIFGVLFVTGFLVGILGHVFESRTLRAVGIAMVFLGTAAFVVAVGTYG
jgi:hypothetical protein